MIQALIGVLVTLAVIVPVSVLLARRTIKRTREMEARTQNSERWAHVGRLAGGLAHEIKNPLSTLNINLQLMEEDWGDLQNSQGRQLRSKIGVLRKEVRRLEEILSDFLRFARGTEVHPVDCDINDLVAEVVDFISPEAQAHGVQVRKGFTPALPRCRADIDLLKQALLNIIINAQQAMPDGGELMVRTGRTDLYLTIDITDTGVGIPKDRLEDVFQVYFSTKKGGTGLGLPTARRIIEDHNGHVLVQSEVGKGTSFQVRLPVVESPQPAAPAKQGQDAKAPPQHATV